MSLVRLCVLLAPVLLAVPTAVRVSLFLRAHREERGPRYIERL